MLPSSRSLPNIITFTRILGAVCLVFMDVTASITDGFWVLYLFCGITDMLDGFLARRLKVETKFGSMFDSIADLCFVICCSCKLIPVITLSSWMWIWAGAIATIKIANQIIALSIKKKCVFPHTLANKLTGLLLFLGLPLSVCYLSPLWLIPATAIATFAAIEEGTYIRAYR